MKIRKCYFSVLTYIAVNIRKETNDQKFFDVPIVVSVEEMAEAIGCTEQQVITSLCILIRDGTIDVIEKVGNNKYSVYIRNFYKRNE